MLGINGFLSFKESFFNLIVPIYLIKNKNPENMAALNPLLNKEYNVSGKTSLNVSTGFIIPIGTDEGPYHVTVKAYKGDKEYTVYPTFEVYGCVTEQFRTRLRR